MALSKEARIANIVDSATSLAKKERSILGSRLKDWNETELATFQASLGKLEGTQEVSRGKGLKSYKKENEQERILAKIYAKLEENETQGVRIYLDAVSNGMRLVGEELYTVDRKILIDRFKTLSNTVDNLSIAKAILQFEQGRLVYFLNRKHSMTVHELAGEFRMTNRKVNDYNSYYLFCLEYPGLIFSTYSMGTIINIRKAIVSKAKAEPRFREVLKLQMESIELIRSSVAGQPEEKMLRRWFEDGKC